MLKVKALQNSIVYTSATLSVVRKYLQNILQPWVTLNTDSQTQVLHCIPLIAKFAEKILEMLKQMTLFRLYCAAYRWTGSLPGIIGGQMLKLLKNLSLSLTLATALFDIQIKTEPQCHK